MNRLERMVKIYSSRVTEEQRDACRKYALSHTSVSEAVERGIAYVELLSINYIKCLEKKSNR